MNSKLLIAALVSFIFHGFVFFIPAASEISEPEENYIKYTVSLVQQENQQVKENSDSEKIIEEPENEKSIQEKETEHTMPVNPESSKVQITEQTNISPQKNTGSFRSYEPAVQDSLTDYNRILNEINAQIRENIVYPRMAQRKNLEGVVTLSFTLGQGGVINGLNVMTSSGYSVLDNAALDLLERISPFDVIMSEVINLKVNIVYELE